MICKLCGSDYPEEKMATKDVCIYCSENLVYDDLEGHQLFWE